MARTAQGHARRPDARRPQRGGRSTASELGVRPRRGAGERKRKAPGPPGPRARGRRSAGAGAAVPAGARLGDRRSQSGQRALRRRVSELREQRTPRWRHRNRRSARAARGRGSAASSASGARASAGGAAGAPRSALAGDGVGVPGRSADDGLVHRRDRGVVSGFGLQAARAASGASGIGLRARQADDGLHRRPRRLHRGEDLATVHHQRALVVPRLRAGAAAVSLGQRGALHHRRRGGRRGDRGEDGAGGAGEHRTRRRRPRRASPPGP